MVTLDPRVTSPSCFHKEKYACRASENNQEGGDTITKDTKYVLCPEGSADRQRDPKLQSHP